MRNLILILIISFASLICAGQDLIVEGDIGIGTNPAYELDIRTKELNDGSELNIGNLDNSHFLRLFSGRQFEFPHPLILWKHGDFLSFGTNLGAFSEKVRITSDGKVGIGTEDPLQKLHVAGDRLRISAPSNTEKYIDIRTDGAELDITSTGGKLFMAGNGGEGMVIQRSTGNVAIGDDTTPDAKLDVVGDIHYTGSITDVSDIRLKENMVPIENPIDKIGRLNGFVYNLIGETKRNAGVSAQQVQDVLPEAVSEIDDGYLGVDYTQLVPLLIEGIKEQQLEIMELKREMLEIRKLLSSQAVSSASEN